MEWLEQNIDAYRIVSEILGELRLTVRQRLENLHGEEWYRKGLPEDVFKRLIAAKEREKSIDWYEGQYQEIMDYAVFADLIEILEHSPEAFPSFLGLAPSTALLNARFLELDVMRAKLGRARPISETELSFLGTFHLRFRKAAQEAKEESSDLPPPREEPKSEGEGHGAGARGRQRAKDRRCYPSQTGKRSLSTQAGIEPPPATRANRCRLRGDLAGGAGSCKGKQRFASCEIRFQCRRRHPDQRSP